MSSAVREATAAVEALVPQTSAYLGSIARARSALSTLSRALTPAEIAVLRGNGNRAATEDWAGVRVRADAGTGFDAGRVSNCTFGGTVLLGALAGHEPVHVSDGVALPAALRGSNLVDVVLGHGCVVADTRLLARAALEDGAAVVGCGVVSCSAAGTSFGNGLVLPCGVEIGGRDVSCYAEMPFAHAVAAATQRTDAAALAAYAAACAAYARRATSGLVVVGAGARLLNAPRVTDTWVGPGALVEGSTVLRSTLLCTPAEPVAITGGAHVEGALVQWGSHVASMAFVESSYICEHAHVERHGKLIDSALGPNSGVAEGEVTASLVGPFVGFHHQALLIATVWPDGKGNVGYGANVGSNHTLKAPDQELHPGEGMFFGLGVCVKFPSNFVAAPYSVVATGATTLPQTLAVPFSLVNMAGESIAGLSPAINEIMPGWVLADALFSVLRNEDKFAKRNKADPARNVVDAEVFRPRTIDWMVAARAVLAAAAGKAVLKDAKGGAVYTDKQAPGIGKNYMTEAARLKGVGAYTFFVKLYGLRGLAKKLRQLGGTAADAVLSTPDNGDARWEHERSMLAAEFGADATVKGLMAALAEAQAEVAKSAEASKARDDKRGVRVIADYDFVHKPASQEPVVVAARKLAAELQQLVSKL